MSLGLKIVIRRMTSKCITRVVKLFIGMVCLIYLKINLGDRKIFFAGRVNVQEKKKQAFLLDAEKLDDGPKKRPLG